MGCDIHAMYEVALPWYEGSDIRGWECAGTPRIGRNYAVFAAIGNVRNYNNAIPYIGYGRLKDTNWVKEYEKASDPFGAWIRDWNGDAHSASYVMLEELREYNTDNEFVAGTLERLIAEMKTLRDFYDLKDNKHIRLIFFFDN